MNARTGMIYALVVVVLSAIGYWYFNNFERVHVEKEVGYRGEALFNRMLAAQRFLASYGASVRSVRSIEELPPPNGTFVIPTARFEMHARQAQALLNWAAQGGHLVVAVNDFGPVRLSSVRGAGRSGGDPLLRELGARGVFVAGNNSPMQPVDIDWPEARDFFLVDVGAYHRLQLARPAQWTLEDERGIYLARFSVGKGVVTVMPNLGFLDNRAIGRYDHAAFLWQLAHLRPGPVWLVYKDTMPGLPAWLVEHAGEAVLSAFLLLAFWLWHAGARLGPLLPVPPLARRRLLEHLEASGRFLWRTGQAERLLKGVRQALFRTLEIRHPAWAALPSAELYRRLAALGQVSADDVQQAMLYLHAGNEHEFTKVVSTLEQLRKSL